MTREQIQKSILLYLYFLVFLTLAIIVAVTDSLPFRLAFVTPENLFLCLMEAELFFVLVIWPLFIPSLLQAPEPEPSRADAGRAHVPVLQVGALFLFALPLALVCEGVSNSGISTFFRSNLQVVALGVFVAALFNLAHHLGLRIAPWYFACLFLVSAAVPYAAFLLLEHGAGGASFARFLCPFWAVLDPPAAVAQAAVFGALALARIAVLPFLAQGRMDGSPAAG